MHKHCNNVSGIIIHPLKQIFPSPFCTHWQKVPLYITKVGCSVRMLNKVMFWASSFFCRVYFKPGDVLECVGCRQLAEASHVLPGLPCPSPFNACRAANIYRASCERPECLLLKLVAPHWECVCIWAMKKRCFSRCSRCVCVCRMRHFPWSLHSLLTLAPGSRSGLRLWAPSVSPHFGPSRGEAVGPHFEFSANDRKMGDVFVRLALSCTQGCSTDITSLRLEHSHKTCFLYFFPNVNNPEGVNTIKGPGNSFSGKSVCVQIYQESSSPCWTRGRTFHCGMVNEVHRHANLVWL